MTLDWFSATEDEQRAVRSLVAEVKRRLDEELAPDEYSVGFNAGTAAGQTVMHLHVHVIPRFRGDMDDPRGGVRYVVPSKGNYLREVPPLATGGEDDPFARHVIPLFERAADIAIVAAFVQESGLDRIRAAVDRQFSAAPGSADRVRFTGLAPRPAETAFVLAKRDATHWQYLGVARQTEDRGIWSLPAVDLAMWRAWGNGREVSRRLPDGALDKVREAAETLLSRPEPERWIQRGERRARIVGSARDGGLRIDGGSDGFAERTVSLTDLAWVIHAADDVGNAGGLLDEARVNKLRYLDGTPKESTSWIDTGWAIAAWEESGHGRGRAAR